MEAALFIGEDLHLLRSAIARAQKEADALTGLVEGIAKDMGVCLDHATPRRECGCVEEASNASRAQRPPDSSVAETPEEEH